MPDVGGAAGSKSNKILAFVELMWGGGTDRQYIGNFFVFLLIYFYFFLKLYFIGYGIIVVPVFPPLCPSTQQPSFPLNRYVDSKLTQQTIWGTYYMSGAVLCPGSAVENTADTNPCCVEFAF